LQFLNTLNAKLPVILERLTPSVPELLLALALAVIIRQLWRRGSRGGAAGVALTGAGLIALYPPLADWVGSLGVDSFDEARAFDWQEAWFWLQTAADVAAGSFAGNSLAKIALMAVRLGLLALVAVAILFVLQRLVDLARHSRLLVASLVALAAYLAFSDAAALYLKNSGTFERVRANFAHQPLTTHVTAPVDQLEVVVYIGESTTSMHMGIYGYPRNTTPRLQARVDSDPGLIVIPNIYSTHTHTSSSLLEALSFAVSKDDANEAITRRQRVSIVDVLKDAGINVRLISNQGQAGTWNIASSIVFAKAESTFSTDSRRAGNREVQVERPWDHAFFSQTLRSAQSKPTQLTVLHSYAGHGAYLKHIPPAFRTPVDSLWKTRDRLGLVGKNGIDVRNIDAYDSAIRYIDFSVDQQFARAAAVDHPMIVIYFSDHGEAPYAGLGHDSALFLHEMARVPFLMYFNTAAQERYQDRFERYRLAATNGHTGSLAQLPVTLLDLFGRRLPGDSPAQENTIGAPLLQSRIVVRDTSKGRSHIDLTALGSSGADYATEIDTLARKLGAAPKVCYHRSNTLGAALRGAMTADCLEIDLVMGEDATLLLTHPPLPAVGVTLAEIDQLATQQKRSVWIDAKNIDDPARCLNLQSYLSTRPGNAPAVLVEFPSKAATRLNELEPCLNAIRRLRHQTSFYVPTATLLDCTRNDQASCDELAATLQQVRESQLFDAISFDYRGLDAIEATPAVASLRWNIWGVPIEDVETLSPDRFDHVIPLIRDPNHR
jgi:glucan phosphoethanolaminetransferase (alkaline phosphatase superfamily)